MSPGIVISVIYAFDASSCKRKEEEYEELKIEGLERKVAGVMELIFKSLEEQIEVAIRFLDSAESRSRVHAGPDRDET